MALEALYRREFHALLALAYALSGSRTAAEDLVRDAFLVVQRRRRRTSDAADPAMTLRQVVVTRSRRRTGRRLAVRRSLGRRRDERILPDELPAPDAALWRALRAMPEGHAQVTALLYVDDRSVAEIARILDCSEGTVEDRLVRVRETVSDVIAPPEDAA